MWFHRRGAPSIRNGWDYTCPSPSHRGSAHLEVSVHGKSLHTLHLVRNFEPLRDVIYHAKRWLVLCSLLHSSLGAYPCVSREGMPTLLQQMHDGATNPSMPKHVSKADGSSRP